MVSRKAPCDVGGKYILRAGRHVSWYVCQKQLAYWSTSIVLVALKQMERFEEKKLFNDVLLQDGWLKTCDMTQKSTLFDTIFIDYLVLFLVT